MRIGPSRLYRVVAPSLFCVWLAACADSTAPIGPPPQVSTVVVADSGGDFYYYQGQKMYLDVDPTRLVVEGIAPDRATNALRGLGIAVQRLERLPARDHWLIRLSAGTAKEQARSAVAALKANREFKFVSNAYKLRQTADDVLPLDRVIVSFKPNTSAARRDSLIAAFGMQVIRPPRPDSGFNYYVLAYPTDSASPLRVAAALDRHQLVAWADPDKISNRHPDAVPSDAYYPLQYYLKNTVVRNGVTVDDNVESAWDLTIGQWAPSSGGLRVGVIGTGIDAAHPDFGERIVSGYDAFQCYPSTCLDDATHPYAGDNHETLVAGLIVAQHDNGGIAGIAPGVYLTAARIFRGTSVVSDQGIADAINVSWQLMSDQVINNSWGGGAPSNTITNAIVAANTQGRSGLGTIVVFSAGNTSQRSQGTIGAVQYPATLAEVVAVGAIDRNGDLTDYTPEGSALDIVAPSGHFTNRCVGDVVSTDLTNGTGCNDGPNGDNLYSTTFSGTSAAAPQITAVVALIVSRNNTLTGAAIKSKLYQAAVPWGPATQFGAGKVDALASVSNVVVTVSGLSTIKNPGSYTWTASATGGNGSYSYTWEESTDGGPYYWVDSGPSHTKWVDSGSGTTFDFRVTAVSGVETGHGTKHVSNLILP